jgi:hypothetical protein
MLTPYDSSQQHSGKQWNLFWNYQVSVIERCSLSGPSLFNYISSEPFAVSAAADMLPSFIALLVYPGYAVNDKQCSNVVSHCVATLRYAPIFA